MRMACVRDEDTGQIPRTIVAPIMFTITGGRERQSLLIFLEKIKHTLLVEKRPVHIDFSFTLKMITDGTLLFYAELDKLARQLKIALPGRSRMIRCSYPEDHVVEQVLQQIGIYKVIGKIGRADIDHENVKHWQAFTGIRLPVAEQAEQMRESYQDSAGSELMTMRLNVGIQEAIINCVKHAYEYPQSAAKPQFNRESRWWMFTQVKDGKLSVALCDLGIGIPASLRSADTDESKEENWKTAIVKDFLALFGRPVESESQSDALLIQAAFELGRSKTKKPNRGKGLSDIKQVLEKAGEGNLQLYSGRGYYRFEPLGCKESTHNYLEPVSGTLILWTIPDRDDESNENANDD